MQIECIRLDPCGGCMTQRLRGLIPPYLVDAPPPLCSFCHTSPPVYSPDASSMKHTLNNANNTAGRHDQKRGTACSINPERGTRSTAQRGAAH